MALEIAEFLWHKFLKSLQESESELSGSIFISYFKSIKTGVKEIDIIFREPNSYSRPISVLYELNDALAECRIFERECKELNTKLLLFNPFSYYFIHNMKNRLKRIKRDLEELAVKRKEIGNRDYVLEKSLPIRKSGVFGFDEQAGKVESLLFEGSSIRPGFTAIGVVGIAGVGKTTMVQMVLESQRVNDEFKPIIWLPFLGMSGEEKKSSRSSFETCILDNLGRTLNERIVGLGNLLERLNQLLSGKRYVVVLDDVRHRHINIEDRLWRGLPKGSGGVVIVTSRLKEVAQKLVEESNLIHVKPLDRERCWEIFNESIKNEDLTISQRDTLEKIKDEIKDQCHGLPLAAMTLAEIIPQQIREIESTRFLREMYIPDELLQCDLDVQPAVHVPKIPVLVFIDMKNEQLGSRLFEEFCYRLNKKQVYAVLDRSPDSKQKVKVENPEWVLKEVYGALEELESKGYGFAHEIQERMIIIIVGGGAVANWILGVISDLKLPKSPSILTIPHGTENNIPFGWKEINTHRDSVTSFLNEVQDAQLTKADSWHILIKMKPTKAIPDSLQLFRPVHKGDMQNKDIITLCGGFWRFFSLGVDAPRWSGAGCFHPTARTLTSLAKVEVMKDSQWKLLDVSTSIKSILCHGFHGELNPSGTPSTKKDKKKHLTPSLIDVGQLDIVAYFLLQHESIHHKVTGIRFKFVEGATEVVNMKIDEAPSRKISLDGILDIEISYHCQVNILVQRDDYNKLSNKPREHGEASTSKVPDSNLVSTLSS